MWRTEPLGRWTEYSARISEKQMSETIRSRVSDKSEIGVETGYDLVSLKHGANQLLLARKRIHGCRPPIMY